MTYTDLNMIASNAAVVTYHVTDFLSQNGVPDSRASTGARKDIYIYIYMHTSDEIPERKIHGMDTCIYIYIVILYICIYIQQGTHMYTYMHPDVYVYIYI